MQTCLYAIVQTGMAEYETATLIWRFGVQYPKYSYKTIYMKTIKTHLPTRDFLKVVVLFECSN